MRITHQMLTRNYNRRMSTNLTNLTQSNEKMSSQRAYSKAAENVTDAGKALRVRKLIADNQRYLTTIRDIEGRAASAEDALRTVTTLMTRVTDRTVYGMNGTMSPEDREKLAAEIDAAQGEVFQIMNTQFNDMYVFSAAGNKDGSQPFTVNAAGELMYNGTAVDQMVKNPATGNPGIDTGSGIEDIPYNVDNYVDIGFGYIMSNGQVDPNTAFKDTYSGVQNFGYGKNADSVPLNAYSLLGDISKSLRADNTDRLGMGLDALKDSMEYMLTSIADIGGRSVTLTDTAAKLEKEYINLAETQGRLEGVDISKEAIFNKDYEMSWMVTLQLGSKVLPSSIFDFIR